MPASSQPREPHSDRKRRKSKFKFGWPCGNSFQGTNKKKVLLDFLMGCNRIDWGWARPRNETFKEENKRERVTQDFDFIWLRCSTGGTKLSTNNENVPMAWLSKCSNQRDAVRACNIASPSLYSLFTCLLTIVTTKVELDFSTQMITALEHN